MPLSVLVLEFDPILRFGEAEMRLETFALAVVIVITLIVAAWIARATPAGEPPADESDEWQPRLRPDDLLFITMGSLPGAVVGGRIGYVLLHLDYYSVHPELILDPAHGSLELTLGVVGGVLSAAYVLRLLRAPVGRWAHVAIFPTLLALGAGKLVQVLGGDGQGLPSDLPWATLYVGEGPWGSLGPEIASHPSQVYEGLATLLLLQVMTVLAARGLFLAADGSSLLVGLALWALIRSGVATTWRDPPLAGPLNAEHVIALGMALACVAILVGRSRWRARRRRLAAALADDAAGGAAAFEIGDGQQEDQASEPGEGSVSSRGAP